MTSEDKIIRTEDLDYVPEPGGFGTTIFRCLKNNGNSISQIDGITGETDTCSTYLQRCIRTALTLRSKGIKKGDIITISCYNHLNSSVPYIGALFIGALTANIDPTVTLEETVYLLKKVKPKMIFIEREHIGHYEEALTSAQIQTELIIFGESNKHTQFSEFLNESKEEENFEPIKIENLDETAIITFSSGSTGFPKGICLSYFSVGYYCNSATHLSLKNQVMVTFSSIYWISQVIMINMSIATNSIRVILPEFDEKIIWQVIAKYKVNGVVMSPSHAISMFKIERPSNLDISSLTIVYIGGAKLADDLLKGFQEELPNTLIVQVYGLTECSGGVLQFDPLVKHERDKLYKSIGHPLKGVSYKVVDVDTEEPLGSNKPGELRLKTRLQMNGFYADDSSDVWDSGGWLKTGDLVYYDDELYFYYVERIKEMIKYRGNQVFPCVLENVLLSHPKIRAAVVIGVAHPEDGDLPTAIVVLKNSTDTVTVEEVVKYVDDKVDNKSRLRGGVKIVKDLPYATSGKPKRKVIRELLRDGKL